jgi:hypothetical protein
MSSSSDGGGGGGINGGTTGDYYSSSRDSSISPRPSVKNTTNITSNTPKQQSRNKKSSNHHHHHVKSPSLQTILIDSIHQPVPNQLVSLALSNGGFIEHKFRKRAWILISRQLNCNNTNNNNNLTTIQPIFKQSQVDLDVARTYGPGQDKKRQQLGQFLTKFFTTNPDLDYYQGFHDVSRLVMEVMGEEKLAMEVLNVISRTFIFKDAFNPNFEAVTCSLWLIHRLLERLVKNEHPECLELVQKLDNPFWAVSMLICCFSHDVTDRKAIERFFDALLVSSPDFIIYLVASFAIVAFTRRKEDQQYNTINNKNSTISPNRNVRRRDSSTTSNDVSFNNNDDPDDPGWAHGFLRNSTQYIDVTRADIIVHSAVYFQGKYPIEELLLKPGYNGQRIPKDGILYFAQQLRDQLDFRLKLGQAILWVALPIMLSSTMYLYFNQ